MDSHKICKAPRKDGDPCKTWALVGDDYCWRHSKSERASLARQVAAHKIFCLNELNAEGRAMVLDKMARKLERDKSLTEAKKTSLLLDVFDHIDQLEHS